MEPPDFDQIAHELIDSWCGELQDPTAKPAIVERLRQVWNARGAADKHAVDVEAWRVYVEANNTGRTDLVVDLVKVLNELDR
jgi:hypothetical protein